MIYAKNDEIVRTFVKVTYNNLKKLIFLHTVCFHAIVVQLSLVS